MDARVMSLEGLQALLDVLDRRGYDVVGPTVRDGAIVNAAVREVADLPVGWGDDQDAGRYRLRRRDDEKVFGFATAAQSAKPVFFPASEVVWRGHRVGVSFAAVSPETTEQRPTALLGVRSCDLSAVGIHDAVLAGRAHQDASYVRRRADAFVVAVACSDPGGTCFCASMGTGPHPGAAAEPSFDLCLTELLDEGGHRFVVEVGSEQGAEVADELGLATADPADLDSAHVVVADAAANMGRTMQTEGLKDLLYASADSPLWDDVAGRCLACGNCTAVCPTCFCTTVEDVADLAGAEVGHQRVWDSCFSADFSYLHGGSVRGSTRSRYRQWMTHKLASWEDQFGMSGCVGCGRCVTWCPAAIDITEEAAAFRQASSAPTTTGGNP